MDERRSTNTAYAASSLERAPRARLGWAAYCPPSLWALGGLKPDLLNLSAPTTRTAEVLSRHGSWTSGPEFAPGEHQWGCGSNWQIFLISRATLQWLPLPFPSALTLRSRQQIPQEPLLWVRGWLSDVICPLMGVRRRPKERLQRSTSKMR